MQGMQGKNSRDEGAFPDSPGHAAKEPEEKQRTEDMQNQVGQMIAAGIQPIELIIHHQGQPGQGMPEISIRGTEGPAEAVNRNAGLDVIVLDNVNIVVNVDKFRLNNPVENGERSACQNDAND